MSDRPEVLLELLASMVRVRRVEERLSDLFSQGKIPGFIHVSVGQEAIAAGVCSCLQPEDAVLTTHRGHGHVVAKGIDLPRFMAEILGRKAGFCKGRAGSMHVADPSVGVMGANGIVGGGLPIALGTALASQYRGERTVTVCFFGDGASNEGTFHESLNVAALWNLPVVFCCENNDWAQFTPQSRYMKVERVAKRAEAYGMPGVTVDGSDARAVRAAAREAVERARRGEGPTLLECKVRRWSGHYVGDVTVSSLGMLGVEEFTAILNPPETVILAVGAIRDRPVAVDGQVVVRPVMKVTLGYDHRVIDGASAARFLRTLRERAERAATVLG